MDQSCPSFPKKLNDFVFLIKSKFTKFFPQQRLNSEDDWAIFHIKSKLKFFFGQVVDFYCILGFVYIKGYIRVIKINDFLNILWLVTFCSLWFPRTRPRLLTLEVYLSYDANIAFFTIDTLLSWYIIFLLLVNLRLLLLPLVKLLFWFNLSWKIGEAMKITIAVRSNEAKVKFWIITDNALWVNFNLGFWHVVQNFIFILMANLIKAPFSHGL